MNEASELPSSDFYLVLFTSSFYGKEAGNQLKELLAADPEAKSGFANHLRKSFSREAAEHGWMGDV
jgi:hypothetical protein